MTFEEAATKVENIVGDLNIPLGVEGTLLDIIEILRDEYAPKIEMTKEQARVLNEYREPDLYDGDDAFYVFFDETCVPRLNSMRDTSLYDNLTESQLMQVWLHPETTKIVEDK